MTRSRTDAPTTGRSVKAKRKSSKASKTEKRTAESVASSWPKHQQDWTQSTWRSRFRKRLLVWFASHARELPWRRSPTPYRVWVSEIMLQQTQVATVLPYYRRWMKSFPSVKKLAQAEESDLMRHWEGLGYYRRVKSMHAAAKMIVRDHSGRFPTDFDDVIALPGIGRYTAGAILSIACDARLPILEGNTQRVFSRLIGLETSPTEKSANQLLWHFAETVLPRSGCGDFNQAAMELGALVCVPKKPLCEQCPLKNQCAANRMGRQSEIPGKIKRIKYEDRTEFVLLIRRGTATSREYLLRPLPEGSRWSGLWDFPRHTDGETESVQSAADWLGAELGTTVRPGIRLKSIRHAVTKYRISLHVHHAEADDIESITGSSDSDWQWVPIDQIESIPLSSTGREIASILHHDRQSLLPLG